MKNTVAKIGEKLTSPSLIIFFNNIDNFALVKFINIIVYLYWRRYGISEKAEEVIVKKSNNANFEFTLPGVVFLLTFVSVHF